MYLIISILIFICSYFFFKKASGTMALTKINMVSYTFYILFFATFIGSILVLYNIDNQWHLDKISSEDVRLYGWGGVLYTMIMTPIGMLIASKVFKVKSMGALFSKYTKTPLRAFFSFNDDCIRHSLYISSFLSLLALLYTVSQVSDIPVFNVGRGIDAGTLAMQRGSARLTGHKLLTDLVETQVGIGYIITYAAYIYWKMEKKYKDLIWFLCTLPITIFMLCYNITKAPVIYFLLGFLFISVIIRGSVSIKQIITTGLIIIAAVMAMYIFYRDVDYKGVFGILNVFYDIVYGRIFTGQLVSYYYCLNIFPDIYPHIGLGSTGMMLHRLLGLEYIKDYGILVMEYYDPIGVQQGIAGHATTFFMGEAWANFGLLGMIIAPLYVGFFIQTFYVFFLKVKKTPIYIAVYAFLVYSFSILSGLKGFYYPAWLFQTLFILFCLILFGSLFEKKGGILLKKSFSNRFLF